MGCTYDWSGSILCCFDGARVESRMRLTSYQRSRFEVRHPSVPLAVNSAFMEDVTA